MADGIEFRDIGSVGIGDVVGLFLFSIRAKLRCSTTNWVVAAASIILAWDLAATDSMLVDSALVVASAAAAWDSAAADSLWQDGGEYCVSGGIGSCGLGFRGDGANLMVSSAAASESTFGRIG